jgi:hypothetical protein
MKIQTFIFHFGNESQIFHFQSSHCLKRCRLKLWKVIWQSGKKSESDGRLQNHQSTDPSTLINFSSNGPTPLKVGVAFSENFKQ